jgi:hypothetical protein
VPARHSALVSSVTFARVAFALTVLFSLTVTTPVTAFAATDTNVSTDPTGAHVRLARRGMWVEVRAVRDGGTGSGSSSATTGCQRRWVPTRFAIYLRDSRVSPDLVSTPMPPRPGPEYGAYYVYCGADYVTSVWLPPTAFAGAAPVIDVRAIAEQLVRDLPYPQATVRVSPEARGLTGLESWFWVDGYRAPLRDAVDGLGLRVEVEAVPGSVRWDFGDDTPVRAGTLGLAAPRRSDVVHTYEQDSRGATTTIRASIRLDVRYRVNGEPWEALDPVLRVGTRDYPVVESRAALVAPR